MRDFEPVDDDVDAVVNDLSLQVRKCFDGLSNFVKESYVEYNIAIYRARQ